MFIFDNTKIQTWSYMVHFNRSIYMITIFFIENFNRELLFNKSLPISSNKLHTIVWLVCEYASKIDTIYFKKFQKFWSESLKGLNKSSLVLKAIGSWSYNRTSQQFPVPCISLTLICQANVIHLQNGQHAIV